ncbi:MAG: ABC transporter permease [Oscillospiraceae bacterium]|nr:ABC transporter permease [Oscillospiraceae bacterium]
MKRLLYPRLALVGIKNNAKLYVPYFFACTALMMIFYITDFLAKSEFVQNQPGGTMIGVILQVGWIVLTAFSAIFLFYTNSFLIKRRKTEFGLYNILGMGKSNIMIVLVCEIGMIFGAAFLLGTGLGIAFSKLVEIVLITILGGENSFEFIINQRVIVEEFCIYLALFGIILVRGMRQIRINGAVELFRSDNSGEKPPKVNWFLAILGAVLLVAGYILANVVENWIWAILAFFVAVILVIAATYLLFISGSSIVCRLLKKNKKYYYKTNHFISVSQMDFRMKKNGAGLASICILATMALVTITSVSGLYFGSEQIMRRNYPRDMSYDIRSESDEFVKHLTDTMIDTAREYGAEPENIVRYNYLSDGNLYAYYRGKKLVWGEELNSITSDKVNELSNTEFLYVPISQYNAVMSTNLTVNKGEALVLKLPSDIDGEIYDLIPVNGELHTEDRYSNDGEFVRTATWCDRAFLKCVGTVDDFVVRDGREINALENSNLGEYSIIRGYAFISDEDFEEQHQKLCAMYGRQETAIKTYNDDGSSELYPYIILIPMMCHYFGMDLDCDDDTMNNIADAVWEKNEPYIDKNDEYYTVNGTNYHKWNEASIYGVSRVRSEFYGLYSGLFFLGILFCVVFVAAAVMIMYYKQITEGYEDKTRYQILQKVGMTKEEIRSTINSQVLAMFFLPLLTAGVHTLFAFGLISKLLKLFGAMDIWFLALVALGCFLVYAVVYVVVYILTSKSYYKIVST